jgi:hypothetical protein
MKDWTGNTKTVFATLGASSHSENDREDNDFYSTDPQSLRIFLSEYLKDNTLSHQIWECACGKGHLSEVLKEYGYDVVSTDLIDRDYGVGGVDFLLQDKKIDMDIITNPPYKYALEFVKHALDIQTEGNKTIMFLKIQFLEGQKRLDLFREYPPKYVYVHSKRQLCFPNGDMSKRISSATCYCWFVWEKGSKEFPQVRWIV